PSPPGWLKQTGVDDGTQVFLDDEGAAVAAGTEAGDKPGVDAQTGQHRLDQVRHPGVIQWREDEVDVYRDPQIRNHRIDRNGARVRPVQNGRQGGRQATEQ